MSKHLTATNIVTAACVVAGMGSYFFYFQPAKDALRITPILGQSSMTLDFEDLTVINKMPFLSYENNNLNISTVKIDDTIFYVPQVKVEPVETITEQEVAAFAPAEIETPKPDYKLWAKSNLKLQTVATNGVVINDRFYVVGRPITTDHVFDDGTTFSGVIERIEDSTVFIRIFDGSAIALNLRG